MRKKNSTLRKHLRVIIIGAGEVGFHLSKRLAAENNDVVVIDISSTALRQVAETADVQVVEGSGASPAVLKEAGIDDADLLLAVTDSDEINIIACTFAASMSPHVMKVIRIRDDDYLGKEALNALEYLKIERIINPDEEVVDLIKRIITFPETLEINEFAGGKVKLVGYQVKNGPVLGQQLIHLPEIMEGVSVVVAAIVRDEQLIIPSGEDIIQAGDIVHFVCHHKNIPEVLSRMGSSMQAVKKIFIVGGGNIGFRLADRIGKKAHVKLLEKDEKRCEWLAKNLVHTIVLHGDGRDQDLLEQENIQEMDMVICLTEDEETNILTALLAKGMGAKRTVVSIDKFAYFPLVRAVGIRHIVSPRQSMINSLLRYVRKGKIVSATTLKGEEAEVLEAVIDEKSVLAGQAVMDLGLPKAVLILSMIRKEEALFPRGQDVIEVGDRVLILALRKDIPVLEKTLEASLKRTNIE